LQPDADLRVTCTGAAALAGRRHARVGGARIFTFGKCLLFKANDRPIVVSDTVARSALVIILWRRES
jgi:hypothetical protein